jgi:hypothetical protein
MQRKFNKIGNVVLNLQKQSKPSSILTTGGPMLDKTMETLHTLMTNQLFIFAVAIVLFFLVITLADPSKGEAVSVGFWI